MKNLKIKVTLFATVVLVASLGLVRSQKVAEISDFTLENVEALASGENGGVNCCPDPGDTCVLSSGDILHDQDEC